MKRFRLVIVLIVAAGVILVTASGSFLVVNQPRKSDLIVVLAGETQYRPALGLQLLRAGYAPRLILDVPAADQIYGLSLLDLAKLYVRGLPEAGAIIICPVYSQSTRGETGDVAQCLHGTKAQSILLVTSDYHTRRALSIFQHQLPDNIFSIAAATDEREFGVQWWRHRQWAKVNFNEWLRLVWWELIDRWR